MNKAEKWNKKAIKEVLKVAPNMVDYAYYKDMEKYEHNLIDPVKYPGLSRYDDGTPTKDNKESKA